VSKPNSTTIQPTDWSLIPTEKPLLNKTGIHISLQFAVNDTQSLLPQPICHLPNLYLDRRHTVTLLDLINGMTVINTAQYTYI